MKKFMMTTTLLMFLWWAAINVVLGICYRADAGVIFFLMGLSWYRAGMLDEREGVWRKPHPGGRVE